MSGRKLFTFFAVELALLFAFQIYTMPAMADPPGVKTLTVPIDSAVPTTTQLRWLPGEKNKCRITLTESDAAINTGQFAAFQVLFFNSSGTKLTSLTCTAESPSTSGIIYFVTTSSTITNSVTLMTVQMTTGVYRSLAGPVIVSVPRIGTP